MRGWVEVRTLFCFSVSSLSFSRHRSITYSVPYTKCSLHFLSFNAYNHPLIIYLLLKKMEIPRAQFSPLESVRVEPRSSDYRLRAVSFFPLGQPLDHESDLNISSQS